VCVILKGIGTSLRTTSLRWLCNQPVIEVMSNYLSFNFCASFLSKDGRVIQVGLEPHLDDQLASFSALTLLVGSSERPRNVVGCL